mgnify:CR=1 FL=1
MDVNGNDFDVGFFEMIENTVDNTTGMVTVRAVMDNANVFEVLMDAVRVCSLGQITNALFEVGGQYRRSM